MILPWLVFVQKTSHHAKPPGNQPGHNRPKGTPGYVTGNPWMCYGEPLDVLRTPKKFLIQKRMIHAQKAGCYRTFKKLPKESKRFQKIPKAGNPPPCRCPFCAWGMGHAQRGNRKKKDKSPGKPPGTQITPNPCRIDGKALNPRKTPFLDGKAGKESKSQEQKNAAAPARLAGMDAAALPPGWKKKAGFFTKSACKDENVVYIDNIPNLTRRKTR